MGWGGLDGQVELTTLCNSYSQSLPASVWHAVLGRVSSAIEQPENALVQGEFPVIFAHHFQSLITEPPITGAGSVACKDRLYEGSRHEARSLVVFTIDERLDRQAFSGHDWWFFQAKAEFRVRPWNCFPWRRFSSERWPEDAERNGIELRNEEGSFVLEDLTITD